MKWLMVLVLLTGCMGTNHRVTGTEKKLWWQKPVIKQRVVKKAVPWDNPWQGFKEPRLFPKRWHRSPKFVIRFTREIEIRKTRDL